MAYDARAIANYFLMLAKRDATALNPMKVQKLVYFAHGWYLAIAGKPLIRDRVEAWRYGPVISDLYHEFKAFGSGAITRLARTVEFEGATLRVRVPTVDDGPDPRENAYVKEFLDRIWSVYRHFTAIQLSNMTHQPDSPWAQTWAANPDRKGTDIDDGLIRTYFVKKAHENENRQRR